jgi:hypothetical protein
VDLDSGIANRRGSPGPLIVLAAGLEAWQGSWLQGAPIFGPRPGDGNVSFTLFAKMRREKAGAP